MKKFFHQLFDDNNSINEKSVVGFIAFLMLCIAFLVDIITGYAGKEFVEQNYLWRIYGNGVGSFGIASIDKWTNRKKDIESPKQEEEEG